MTAVVVSVLAVPWAGMILLGVGLIVRDWRRGV